MYKTLAQFTFEKVGPIVPFVAETRIEPSKPAFDGLRVVCKQPSRTSEQFAASPAFAQRTTTARRSCRSRRGRRFKLLAR